MSSCRSASGREGGQRARSVKKRKNVDHISSFRGAPAYPGGATGRGLFYKPPGAPFPRFTFLGFARRGARNWAEVKRCPKKGGGRWRPFKKGDTNGILKMWSIKKVPRQPPQWTPPSLGGRWRARRRENSRCGGDFREQHLEVAYMELARNGNP